MWFVYMGRHNTVIVIHHLAQKGTWSVSRQSTNWRNFTKYLRQLKRQHQKLSFIKLRHWDSLPGFNLGRFQICDKFSSKRSYLWCRSNCIFQPGCSSTMMQVFNTSYVMSASLVLLPWIPLGHLKLCQTLKFREV